MFELTLVFIESKSAWEWLAVLLSLTYVVLAIRENIWCWPAALLSTLIYTWLFWNVSLVMDSALNAYYMAMALYGFWVWRSGESVTDSKRVITAWKLPRHVLAIAVLVIVSVISGNMLERYTEAAWPYLDSFTTWASVFATYLVAQKVLENWLYWIVIDVVSIALYVERGLYPTAILFGIYTIMAIVGFRAWKRSMAPSVARSMARSARSARADLT